MNYVPFVIGIIVIFLIVVGGNLYLDMAEKKEKLQEKSDPTPDELKVSDEEAAEEISCETAFAEAAARTDMESASDAPASAAEAVAADRGFLEQYILQSVTDGRYIFGIPMKHLIAAGLDKLLMTDKENNIYVIETYAGMADEDIVAMMNCDIAQISAQLMPEEGRVYGIICMESADDALKTAVGESKNLRLFTYKIRFESVC